MFGTAVRKLRFERGMKQSDLAKAVGIARQDVYQLETRNKTLPPTEVFERIADALQVSKEYLLVEAGYLDHDANKWELDERIIAASKKVPEAQIDAFIRLITGIADALAAD